ncbi:MAG TPA: TrkA family potassium uptake protein [Actinomycetota bacterium]|jgi:trk system potassium uptake protein TrkA
MKVLIMGCGRVGAELTIQLAKAGHEVSIIDKRREAFERLPPDFQARTFVGIGFDREDLEEAGIKEADAFIAVSSGDNSNILSARVAREYYHVPQVIARIYDPRRAEIYERLNIPTVASVRWAAKQVMLMLFHTREEIKETLGGGDLFRMKVKVPEHLVGKPVSALNADKQVMVVGVERGGQGFIPDAKSTFQDGDAAHVIVHRDALDKLDEMLAPLAEG